MDLAPRIRLNREDIPGGRDLQFFGFFTGVQILAQDIRPYTFKITLHNGKLAGQYVIFSRLVQIRLRMRTFEAENAAIPDHY